MLKYVAEMTTARAVRYRCDLLGRFEVAAGAAQVRVLELSEGGAFVEYSPHLELFDIGDEAVLVLPLPGGSPWSSGVRVVRHGRSRLDLQSPIAQHVTVSVVGFGLEFVDLPDDDLEQLRGFLELLDAR